MVSVKSQEHQEQGTRERQKSQKVDLRRLGRSAIAIPEPETFTAGEIRALRDELQISQAVFAKLLGTSKAAVTQWEQGLRRPTRTASKMLGLVKRKGLEILL